MSHLTIKLNFWQAKQLEYWLKDNYPECTISPINLDCWLPPEEPEWYRIDGKVDVDLSCLIQLKYGTLQENTLYGKI